MPQIVSEEIPDEMKLATWVSDLFPPFLPYLKMRHYRKSPKSL
jgi:hypothetical protein